LPYGSTDAFVQRYTKESVLLCYSSVQIFYVTIWYIFVSEIVRLSITMMSARNPQ